MDNGEWEYGSLYQDYDCLECASIIPIGSLEYQENIRFTITAHDVIPKTIGRFTGFITVANQEVYQNDIVKDGAGRIYVVRHWGGTGNQPKGCGGFESWMCCTKTKDGNWLHHTKTLHFHGMEVIGNIYDNPDLLK